MKSRLDFRVNQLEKKVFGTTTPTAGTDRGASITGNDMITRIAELEAQLSSTLPLLTVSEAPADASGSNGQWAFDATHEHLYFKLGGTWRQIQ